MNLEAPTNLGLPRRRAFPRAALASLAALSVSCLGAAWGQSLPEYELAPLHYSATAASNAVTDLQRLLEQGQVQLRGPTEQETLRRCLDALSVSPDTQVLVFSKTSLQRRLIRPDRPRALYFSDDCYVGWVPGGLLEVAHTDPRLGLAFYRVDARPGGQPVQVLRDEDCLSCHAGPLTRGWPALMIRSVYPDETGEPVLRAGSFLVEHDTPISNRWGGWYVTGSADRVAHLGNRLIEETAAGIRIAPPAATALTNLAAFFPVAPYLRPDSDIVALMVLEHQVGMHNRLAEGGLRVRKWMHYQRELQRELGEPVRDEPTGTALRVIQSEAHRIVKHLLFVDEAPLPEGGIQGHAAFLEAFRANRRPDEHGRSLKDFDLHTRLFEWRCSFLIYSQAFDGLPRELETAVYDLLETILRSPAAPAGFDHLATAERRGIHAILRATKPELAQRWPPLP